MVPPARRGLSLTQQAIRLATRYSHVDRPLVRCGRLLWSIPLQPTPISVTYTVAVDYQQGHRPHLYVVDPELEGRLGEERPHTFTENGSLCLYFGLAEFSPRSDFIADTLVPWASEWLLHYELWLVTGDWHGGGIEHGSRKDPQ